MSNGYIPSRFKQKNVERFVPFLRRVSQAEPEVRFKPFELGLNPTTAIARIGDAAIAFTRGLVSHPNVNVVNLIKQWPLYKLVYDPLSSEVVIRLRQPTSTASSGPPIVEHTLNTHNERFTMWLKAFALIYGDGLQRGKITILGMLDPELKTELEHSFNVIITQISPNEHIMI